MQSRAAAGSLNRPVASGALTFRHLTPNCGIPASIYKARRTPLDTPFRRHWLPFARGEQNSLIAVSQPFSHCSRVRTANQEDLPMKTDDVVPDWYDGESLYRGTSHAATLGPDGSRGEFRNKEGLKLASYTFPAQGSPRGLVIMVHGHGCSFLHEYLYHKEPGKPGVYSTSLIERLNKAGIAAAGIDLQGCGHSEGLRCYVDRYQDYVDDVQAFTLEVQKSHTEFQGLPIFVIGVSLGGCIAADLCKQSDLFRGAVLIAPMLSLERVSKAGLNPYLRPLSGLLSWLVPTAKLIKTTRNVLYPEIQAFFDQDPQTWKENTRTRNADEYLNATERLCADMGTFTFPFACYHGEVDTMTDPEGSKKLFADSKADDKELDIIPDRWHVLLKEKGAEDLHTKAVDWICKRV